MAERACHEWVPVGAMTTSRGRAPRGSLDADQIVDAACGLIASVGLTKFSMPSVAKQLDVGVTSLYWYFRSKDELLRAVAERVTAEFYDGLDDDEGVTGEERVLRQFRLYWRRLQENLLWREIFISSFAAAVSTSPESRRRAGHVVRRQVDRMVDAGLNVDEATAAYRVLSTYTRGAVLVMRPVTDYSFFERELSSPAREAWAGLQDDEALFDQGLRALWNGILARSLSSSASRDTSIPDHNQERTTR